MMKSKKLVAALVAATLPLAACSEAETSDAGTEAVSDETLAALIGDQADMAVVGSTLSETGLADIFSGAASYTLLVPRDAVFEELGETGEVLQQPEQRAVLVALVREHMVPGYLTPADITAAIDSSEDSSVVMTSMGETDLTFTRDENAIVVTGEDGSTARFAPDAIQAINGVAIPIDGLLKSFDEAPAE